MPWIEIDIPDDLLEQVDADALTGLRSRSSVVQQALEEHLSGGCDDGGCRDGLVHLTDPGAVDDA